MPPLDQKNRLIRSEYVTASEVGALLGPGHPYTTPEAIYDRLTSPVEPVERSSEAMLNGTFMEPAIARLAASRLGLRLRANRKTYVHKTSRLCATPDYLVLGSPPGLVEIKLSGRPEIWPLRGPIPVWVEAQVRAQLACTGRYTAAVCVLVGVGLRTFLLEREADKEEALLAAVDRFWTEHVAAGVRPVPVVLTETELVLEIA